MKKTKLGNICVIKKGTKLQPVKANNDTVRLIQIEDLRNDDNIKFCLPTPKSVIAEPSDIIIAWDGANAGTIGFGINGAIGSTLAIIRVQTNSFDSRYIGFLLKGKFDHLRSNCTGATIPHIYRKSLEDIGVPSVTVSEQINNVGVLQAVSEILAMRKQQLAELDDLIKSIFYDMFGDPTADEKGWPRQPIGQFSTVRIGPFGSLLHKEDYIRNGRPLINPSHITDGRIIPDSELTVSDAKFDELHSYQMYEGDIVVGRRGEIGRCAVVEENRYLCGTGSMFVRIKQEYLPGVLQYVISTQSIRSQLEHKSVGVTMKNLNASAISSLEVPIIPLSLQQEFLNLKQKIDASKVQVIDVIGQTQYLFDSLMSHYFD